MAKQLLAIFFLICLALLASSKNTIHVDNIYPATEPYVTIDRANADNTDVGVLNVGVLNVPSPAGVTASSGSLSIDGSSLSATGENSISFSTSDSGISIVAASVGDFVAGTFSVDSGKDLSLSTSTSTLTVSSAQDLVGNFSSDISTNGNRLSSFIAGNGNFQLSVSGNINSTTGFVDFNGGSGSTVEAGNLQVSARQTFTSSAEDINWKASNSLVVTSNNNNVLLNSGNDIIGNFSTQIDFSGADRFIIDSPQGTVTMSAKGNIDATANIIDVISHRNIDITSVTGDIDFSSQGNVNVNGVSGVTLQTTTGSIFLNSDIFSVHSSQLLIDYAGQLTINTVSTSIQASESLSINSQSGISYTANSQSISITGPQGVNLEAYTTLNFGTDDKNDITSGDINFYSGEYFFLQAGTSIYVNASTAVNLGAESISITNNNLGTNNFNYQGTKVNFDHFVLGIAGANVNFESTNSNFGANAINIGQVSPNFGGGPTLFDELDSFVQVVSIGSQTNSYTFTNSLSFSSFESQISALTASISGTNGISLSSGGNVDLSATSSLSATISGAFTVTSSNLKVDGASFSLTGNLKLSSFDLSIDAFNDLNWSASSAVLGAFTWNAIFADLSANTLNFASTSGAVSLSSYGLTTYQGSWTSKSAKTTTFTAPYFSWESQIGNDINLISADVFQSAGTNLNIEGRQTSITVQNNGVLGLSSNYQINFNNYYLSLISLTSSSSVEFNQFSFFGTYARNQDFTQSTLNFKASNIGSTSYNATSIVAQNELFINSPSVSVSVTKGGNINTGSFSDSASSSSQVLSSNDLSLLSGADFTSTASDATTVAALNGNLYLTSASSLSVGSPLNTTAISITSNNAITHTLTANLFGDLTLTAPTTLFTSANNIGFSSNSKFYLKTANFLVNADLSGFTAPSFDLLVQGTFLANANNITFNALGLNISSSAAWTTLSNNDVFYNAAGALSVITSAADANGNGIFLFSSNANAGVSVSTAGNLNFQGNLQVQFTVSDLSNFGHPTTLTSPQGIVYLETAVDPFNNPAGIILQSGSYDFDESLELNFGALFSAQTGTSLTVNSDNSDIFATVGGPLDFQSHSSFSLTATEVILFGHRGNFFSSSQSEGTTSAGYELKSGSDIQYSSNGDANFQVTHGFQVSGNNIEFVTNNGAISIIDDSNQLFVNTLYSENLATGNFFIMVQNQTQFINNNNDIVFVLNAGGDISFDSYGSSLYIADGAATFTAVTTSVTSSIGHGVTISWEGGLSLTTTQDFSLIADTTGAFTYFNYPFSFTISTFTTGQDVTYTSYGSVAFENTYSITIQSVTNQYYNGRQTLLVDATNSIVVNNAQISIFAGGAGVKNAVNWNSNALQVNSTNSIKQSANEFALQTKDFSFVGTNGITFTSLGTPGVAQDLYAFGNFQTYTASSNFYSTATTGSIVGSTGVEIQSLGPINVTVARLLDIGVSNQVIIDDTNVNLSASGKFSFSNLNNFEILTGSLSFLADTTATFQSGALSFIDGNGAFSVTAENLNNFISFTTLDDTSNIVFESQTQNVSFVAHNRFISNVNNGIDFASTNTLLSSQDEIDVNTVGSFNQFYSSEFNITAEQITFLVGGHSYFYSTNVNLNDNNLFIQSDNNILFNSSSLTSYSSAGAATFESGFNTTYAGGSAQLSAGYFDYIVRGKSVENYGALFQSETGIYFNTAGVPSNISFTGSQNVDISAHYSILNAGNNMNISAFGAQGVSFSTNRAASPISLSGDIQFNAQQSIQFNAFGNQYASGIILFNYLDAAAFFGGGGTFDITSSAGVTFKGLSNSFEIPSTGSIVINADGETDLGVGMTFESSGFINFITAGGATAFVGDSIKFFVDQRPLDSLSSPPFGIYSLDNPGFQAQSIEMTAFGPNENGNGIEISSADQDTDIIISAEIRGEVQFNSGSEILVEGSHGVSIFSKDDNVITSVSGIQLAGLGKTYVDNEEASVLFSSTNPLGAASGNTLGTNIQFFSTSNINLVAADALVQDIAQTLTLATSLSTGTTSITGNNGINIHSPFGNLIVAASTLIEIEGNSFTLNTDSNIIAQSSTTEFVAYNRDVDFRAAQGITITGNLVAQSGLDYIEVSNDDYFVINETNPGCPGSNGWIYAPNFDAGVGAYVLPVCVQGNLVKLTLS